MTKAKVIQRLREKGLSRKQARELLDILLAVIDEELDQKGVAKIRGFGAFKRGKDGRVRFSSFSLKKGFKL